MLAVYRRHRPSCKHRSDRYYARCKCACWCKGTIEGHSIQKSLKTRSWERAVELARQLEEGKHETQEQTITAALEAFIADSTRRNFAGTTIAKHRLLQSRLQEFAGREAYHLLHELTPEVLRRFQKGRSLSPRTSGKELGFLTRFFNFCIENEWITKNPAKLIRPPKVKINPRLPFSEQEIQNILAQAKDDKELAFILTLRHTGLRIGDASLLKISQFSASDERIHLYTTKAGTPVSIRVPATLASLLKALPPHGGYFFLRGESIHRHSVPDSWRKRIKAICKRLGIVPDHPHRFRHSLAADLLTKGVSVENVAAVLGNSPAIVMKHYSQFVKSRQDALDRAVESTWDKSQGIHVAVSSK